MEERGYVGPADGSRPREVYSIPLSGGGVAVKAAPGDSGGDEDPPAAADEAEEDYPAADVEEEGEEA